MSGSGERRLNPFATRWTRPGVLPYLFPPGADAAGVVDRLRARRWRGAIVGPHGSGKSTLVATLLPQLAAAQRFPVVVTLRDGQRRWPPDALLPDRVTASTQLIVDGYEQLSWSNRLRLQWLCWRYHAGLLVTSHARTWLRPVFTTAVSEALTLELVHRLVGKRLPAPSDAEVRDAFNAAGGDVRETLFALYDWYEHAVGT